MLVLFHWFSVGGCGFEPFSISWPSRRAWGPPISEDEPTLTSSDPPPPPHYLLPQEEDALPASVQRRSSLPVDFSSLVFPWSPARGEWALPLPQQGNNQGVTWSTAIERNEWFHQLILLAWYDVDQRCAVEIWDTSGAQSQTDKIPSNEVRVNRVHSQRVNNGAVVIFSSL